MKVMVDASNEVANAFYQRYGFEARGQFQLFGRVMNWYQARFPQALEVLEGRV